MFRSDFRHRGLKSRAVDALVWLLLVVVLPGVLYAMSVEPKTVGDMPRTHDSAHCSVCRHYRGLSLPPSMISDPAMVLVAPGHPLPAAAESPDN